MHLAEVCHVRAAIPPRGLRPCFVGHAVGLHSQAGMHGQVLVAAWGRTYTSEFVVLEGNSKEPTSRHSGGLPPPD